MYKKLISVFILTLFLVGLIAVSPVQEPSNAVDVLCGTKVATTVTVRSIQGPSLYGPCKPVESPKEVTSNLVNPGDINTNPVGSKTGFTILTVSEPAWGGFSFNQYSSGSNRGILANDTTNRSFSIGSTGYRLMWLVTKSEDDECAELQTTWQRDPVTGVTVKGASVYNRCSSTYEYSATMDATWVAAYERNISFGGTTYPGYSHALIQTSAGCFRGTFYNYSAGAWQWKGNAMCGSTAAREGTVIFELASNQNGTYPTYSTPEFLVMNGYTLNASGVWDLLPDYLKYGVLSDPPFNSNPYRYYYGSAGSPFTFWMQGSLHT